MKNWFRNLWNSGARKYVLIGLIAATGVGAPVAVSVGTAVDQGIEQMESAE
ncbi:hypothetical protein [Marinobacter sp.]|uniref:hypothetical protein n=1 Tax=Marinobacter sp. TaxID=50741 RepID=UPI0035C73AC8